MRDFMKIKNLKGCLLTLATSFLLFSCGHNMPKEVEVAYEKLPDRVDFNYHVKPILSDKCFACHGPDMKNQKAGLRLDIAENVLEVLKSGKQAIVPKNLSESEAIHRIFSEDPQIIMPPAEFNVTLTTTEKAIITKWVEQGAEYKPHWSFIKPEKAEKPEIEKTDWVKNDIDVFVAHTLEEKELEPSERATKETLIRRLSFSLTGLPPTIQQIENFVADTSKDAYEKLIDEFLTSSAYGERMAANWMDVARYADSDGYLDDKHRNFSPWRDWVIKSFNENMSYDAFVTKQLAGDLLPDADTESVLATAFNRLHKKNSEAGIVFEEYRSEYVADRAATVSKAFLGLSVECARCHDHKYDPISQKDHYKMYGFFNSTNEIGTPVYGPYQTPGPSLLLTNEEQSKLLDYLNNTIHTDEEKLTNIKETKQSDFKSWIQKSSAFTSFKKQIKKGLIADYALDVFSSKKGKKNYVSPSKGSNKKPIMVNEPDIKKGVKGKGVFINEFTNIKLPFKVGKFDQTDPFSIDISLYPDKVHEEAVVFHHCENLRVGLKGYSMFLENNHVKFIIAFSWPTNAIEVVSEQPIAVEEWSNISVTYDGSAKAKGVKLYNHGKEIPVKVNADNLYKSIVYKKNIHTYGFKGFGLGNRGKMKAFKGGGIDELKIYNRRLSALEVLYNHNVAETKEVFENKNDPENQKMLSVYYHENINSSYKKIEKGLRNQRKELAANLDSIPEIMVLGDLPEPRPTYVLERGSYDAYGEEVQPGVPEAVLPFGDDLPKNRLGLSQWLFDKNNPLTARVFVNRIWQMHFGKGIVKTSDDFGNQGSLPSHPELLDWLAITFMESGWDIKKLHKTILMSATYQQSSKVTPELLDIDTENVLLARGPSFRLPAEMIRDNALALSGLLSHKMGGRSVYPYQPKGLWKELSKKKWRYKYKLEKGENLYRRSLYTVWKRTSPPPSMMIFDASDRSVCNVKRRQTSTPLQALVLLNDPQFLEASRVMAQNIIETHKNDSIQQLKQAFVLGIGRTPDVKEMNILKAFYQDEITRFTHAKEDARKYASIGASPLKENIDIVKTAALATVINGIMNTTDSYTLR